MGSVGMVHLREYLKLNGKSSFQEWFHFLKDDRAKMSIDARLENMKCGHFGKVKSVGKGVLELKIYYGPGYRIYFGLLNKSTILLLCGGTKKTQRVDIKKAHQFWSDYRRRS